MASNMTTLDEKRKRRATANYCLQPLRVFGKKRSGAACGRCDAQQIKLNVAPTARVDTTI
jgi:hypothetical protein